MQAAEKLTALERFKEIADKEGRHKYAKDWKARTGNKVFGYFCTYVPEEIIYAADILPVRVMGSLEAQDVTDKYMASTRWCAYCRDTLAQGLKGKYDYLDGVINAFVCDHIRNTFEAWVLHLHPSFWYEYLVPHATYRPVTKPWIARQLRDFRGALEEWSEKTISDEDMHKAIEVYDLNRRLMKDIYEMRKADKPPLTGTEAITMVLASQYMDKKEHNVLLEQFKKELAKRKVTRETGPRIVLMGSTCYDLGLTEFVESLGCTIVADETCTGMRYFWYEAPLDQDPISSIAERVRQRPPCPLRDLGYPGRRNPAFVRELVETYNAQAVIFLQQKFCDTWCYEIPQTKKLLDQINIPLLWLETDVVTPVGQFRTRVEALIESLSL